MCQSCNIHIDGLWFHLALRQRYRTPDERKGVEFSIGKLETEHLIINPQCVRIKKASFAATLHYLRVNHHDERNPCPIESSNDPSSAGPLCRTARKENNNIRCINYILPILADYRIVGLKRGRPNMTWLIC